MVEQILYNFYPFGIRDFHYAKTKQISIRKKLINKVLSHKLLNNRNDPTYVLYNKEFTKKIIQNTILIGRNVNTYTEMWTLRVVFWG